MNKWISITLCLTCFIYARNPFCNPSDIDDQRDGRCYTTVRIGNQIWMSENLTYRENLPGKVWLVEDVPNYWKIGVYYTWSAAMKACPEDWHLPSVEEWEELFRYAGGTDKNGFTRYEVAIKNLKSIGDWGSPKNKGNGTNKYGFNAWPMGMVYKDGTYMNVGGSTHFWTTKPGTIANFPMASEYGGFNYYSTENGYSVRCIKD